MSRDTYSDLIQRFGPVKWIPGPILNLPDEGWFLLEITPCPPKNEMEKVISDIYHNRIVRIRNGKLYHSDKCTAETHKLQRELMKIVGHIKEESFTVAVYPGLDGLLLGQPIAIVLNKPINYSEYPDHPHINLGGFVQFGKKAYPTFLPESICYGFNHVNYSSNENEKLYEVFAQITIWLFRHQIWCATRNILGKGIWIGPHEGFIEDKYYVDILNPLGQCRCGSHKSYADCHMPQDYSKAKNCTLKEASEFINDKLVYFVIQWKNKFETNQNHSIELLNSKLS